jgi:uncharacterized protein (DUF885 family)
VPGKFWINMHTMSVFTTYNTPTLTYHESIPGHVWQGEYTFKLPLCRSLLAFNAYSEGWALYAEQLANELGVYDDDPFGSWLSTVDRVPCLRLVVDYRPARETLDSPAGHRLVRQHERLQRREVTSEVDRYCAWPGQACGYKVGHSEINRLRTKARLALGVRVRPAPVQRRVVKGGGVPMVTLARTIDEFIRPPMKRLLERIAFLLLASRGSRTANASPATKVT